MTSSRRPALIFEPKPPSAPFHKNATADAPNAPTLAPISVIAVRLKNMRRDTPTASASGATNGAISAGAAFTMSVVRAASSTSRPVVAVVPTLALRSLARVSRESAPAPRTSVLRAVVITTMAPNTTAAITTTAIISPVLITIRSLTTLSLRRMLSKEFV